MYYAQSTGGFYDRAIHGESVPADAVEITAEAHMALLVGRGQGKIIITTDDAGYPVLADPPLTLERLSAVERDWRNSALVLADNEVRKHEDADPGATAAEHEWRAYRSALRAWPESTPFPDAAHRPVAPA